MDVKPEYQHIINKLATGNTEFAKAEQETLAIIAYKQPIKQSVIIKIRGNKAYDHVKKFFDLGLIKKKKTGHTYELSLSDEFYDYFNIEDTKSPLKTEKDLEEEYADELSELREEKIKLGTLIAEKEAEYVNRLSLLDEQSRGLAIARGDLEYWASWETSTTKIDLMLLGDNYKIKLILSYISKGLEEWVKQTKEKEASKDF